MENRPTQAPTALAVLVEQLITLGSDNVKTAEFLIGPLPRGEVREAPPCGGWMDQLADGLRVAVSLQQATKEQLAELSVRLGVPQ